MHLTFYSTAFENYTTAMHSRRYNALLVLAVLFDTGIKRNPSYAFTRDLKKVSRFGNTTLFDLSGLEITQLLPKNLEYYYTFQGSLTTPPCSAIAKWIVFGDPVAISAGQINSFSGLYDSNDEELQQNARELQDKDGRKIFVNNKPQRSVIDENHRGKKWGSVTFRPDRELRTTPAGNFDRNASYVRV